MKRREFVNALAGTLAGLTAGNAMAAKGKNIEWAFSLGLWGHLKKVPFTEVLDVMKDTGFRGLRLTGFPGVLKTYDLSISFVQKELEKRHLRIATISYGGPAWDETQHQRMEKSARAAMSFLQNFGATELVVFSPGRLGPGRRPLRKIEVPEYIVRSCAFWNRLGDVARNTAFARGFTIISTRLSRAKTRLNSTSSTPIRSAFTFPPIRRTCIWPDAMWSSCTRITATG